MKFGIAAATFASLQGLVYAQLPPYEGEYGVGYMTVEVPVSYPRSIGPQRIVSTTQAAFNLQTVLFNIFYPADKNNQSTKASPHWIQDLDLIVPGIAASANGSVDPSLISIGLGALAGNAVIPAFTDVPLVGESAYPIYIFSHGDTSLPQWYSHYLGSIAADGNIVVAITHRDGSNAGSQVIIKGQEGARNITYLTPDMLIPRVNATGLAMLERKFRQAEVEEVVIVLQKINDGQGEGVYQNNSRGDGERLGDWKGRLDLTKLVVGGHSFGATSALDSLQSANLSDTKIAAGLVLDPGKESGPLSTNVEVPLLIADSEAWSAEPSDLFGQDHFTVVKGIAETSLRASNAGWFITLLGSAHVSITDAGLIAGTSLLSLFDPAAANATLEPATAISKYVETSVEFFRYLKNGSATGILALNVTDPEYVARAANSSTPDDQASYWEIHVAPVSNGTATSGSGSGSGSSSGSAPGATSSQGSGAVHNMGASLLLVLCACSAVLSLIS